MTKYLLSLAFAVSAICFTNYEAHAAQAVELIEIDQQTVQISVVENSIRVVGGNGLTMQVYNIAGVCIHTVKVDGLDKRFDLGLPKGCYIIKVGKTARKVSIR